MKIHPGLITAALSLLIDSYAAEGGYWELASKFFRAKSIHSVDAYVCTISDGLKLYRSTTNSSGNIPSPVLLRIVHDSEPCPNLVKRTGIIMDVSCAENQKRLFRIAGSRGFTTNFCWLVWDSEGLLADSYHRLPLSTFSDVNVASHNRVTRLHKHKLGMPLISREVGFWSSGTNEYAVVPWNVRIDYMKAVVNGAIMFIDDIYDRSLLQQQLQDDQYEPGNDVSNRFIYGNTLHLAYLFNFTLNLTETQTWGDRASNGTWSGLIGLLQRREADLTISPLLPISQRLEVSYPSVPILPYWMAAIVKQPRALGTYRAMLMELSPTTWAFVALVIISGSIVFTLTQRHGRYEHNSDGSLAMGFLQSVGIIANQGLNLIPEGTPARIACLTLLLVGLLVSNHYSAAIMTALLSPSPPFIKNLEQLMSSTTPISAIDAPYVHLIKSRSRVFRKIVTDRMEKDLKLCSLTDGIMGVLNGSAFLGEYFVLFRAITEHLQSDVVCDLSIFNAGFHQNAVSFTKKCPHFRELYTRGMLRTLEHGLMPKERQRWIAGLPVCSRKTEFIHVHLEAVSVAVGILLIGFVTSQLLLITEVLIDRRKQSSRAWKRRHTEADVAREIIS